MQNAGARFARAIRIVNRSLWSRFIQAADSTQSRKEPPAKEAADSDLFNKLRQDLFNKLRRDLFNKLLQDLFNKHLQEERSGRAASVY